MSKQKVLTLVGVAALLLLLLLPGSTFSSDNELVTLNGSVSTGDIRIAIENKAGDEPYTLKDMEPGLTVNQAPIIKNMGDKDVYLRVWVEVLPERVTLSELSMQWQENWVLGADRYYYYTKKLTPGERIGMFANLSASNSKAYTLRIPEQWTQKSAPSSISISVIAESVQADNFAVDFTGIPFWDSSVEME